MSKIGEIIKKIIKIASLVEDKLLGFIPTPYRDYVKWGLNLIVALGGVALLILEIL